MTAAATPETRPLHMWTADDEEWVIAYDAIDARDVYCAQTGLKPELSDDDPDGADCGLHWSHWTPIPDDEAHALRTECDESHRKDAPCPVAGCENGVVRRTMTAGEWVAETGRGYWGSANW